MATARFNHVIFLDHHDLDGGMGPGGGLYATAAAQIQNSGFVEVLLGHGIWNRTDHVPTSVLEDFIGDLVAAGRNAHAHFAPPAGGETQEWLDAAVARADSVSGGYGLRKDFVYCDGDTRWPVGVRDYVTQLTTGVTPDLVQAASIREAQDLLTSSPSLDPPHLRLTEDPPDEASRQRVWKNHVNRCGAMARAHRLLMSGSGYRLNVGWVGPSWNESDDPGWSPPDSLITLPWQVATRVGSPGGSVVWRTSLYHLDAMGAAGRQKLRDGIEGNF